MALTQITEKGIKDGEIVNADINASAAIAGSKLSPDFGSQNIATTGTLSTGDHVTLSGQNPRITFTDSNHNPDFELYGSAGNFKIWDSTNAVSRLTIDSSGRLLVGTTTEGGVNADDLTIANSGHTGLTIRSGTSSVGSLYFSDGTSGDDEYRGVVQYNHTDNFLRFYSDAAERMRIDSSGRMLIGKTSTSETHPLQVQADSNADAIAIYGRSADDISEISFFENDGTTRMGDIQYRTTELNIRHRSGGAEINFQTTPSGGSVTDRMVIKSDGNVGIGTSSPAKKLHVYEAGVATIQLETGDSRGQAFNILSTNGAQNNTGTLSIRNEASQSFIDFSHNEGSPFTKIYNTGSQQFTFDSDGLKFGSDTAAANALDDYEIGSWSPTIDSGTFTQYNQAWYIKVGKLVTCYFYIYNFSDNSSSTNFVVGGLPYAYNNSPKHESFCDVQHGGAGASFPSGVIGISGRIGQGTTTELELIIRYHNGTPRYMRHEDLGSVHLHTTFSYEAA